MVLLQRRLFLEHRGGQSLPSPQSCPAVARNAALIQEGWEACAHAASANPARQSRRSLSPVGLRSTCFNDEGRESVQSAALKKGAPTTTASGPPTLADDTIQEDVEALLEQGMGLPLSPDVVSRLPERIGCA